MAPARDDLRVIHDRDWLSRYREGREAEVWNELAGSAATIRESSDLSTAAQAVCDEMARRARHNIETIVGRLQARGFRFHSNDDDQSEVIPFRPAGPAAEERIAWLESRFGRVPMTLTSWLRIVGDVWLVGTDPQWPDASAADPLVIEIEGSRYPDQPIQDYLDDEYQGYLDYMADSPEPEPFVLSLSPDRFHKDNVSGGAEYGLILPDPGIDGQFVTDTTVPFIAYLNNVFHYGGFPWPTQTWTTQTALTSELASGLLTL